MKIHQPNSPVSVFLKRWLKDKRKIRRFQYILNRYLNQNGFDTVTETKKRVERYAKKKKYENADQTISSSMPFTGSVTLHGPVFHYIFWPWG